MNKRDLLRSLVMATIGWAVGILVCLAESMFCDTAYGGPFTIVASIALKLVFTGLAVSAAWLMGLVLLVPGIRELWTRIGYWPLLPPPNSD